MLFLDLLKRIDWATDPARQKAEKMAGDEILRLSNIEVPFDKGILSFSGRVDAFPNYVEVGYHTKYAHRLHEHPEYNFQNGRKGKYLEDPIKHNLSLLQNVVGRTLGAEIFR
jgi:hypothetical protein